MGKMFLKSETKCQINVAYEIIIYFFAEQ